MRRVPKGQPPTDVSPSGQKPRSLIEAEKLFLADLPAQADHSNYARTQFDELNKGRLRDLLYSEQKSLCVYCETPVKERHPAPPIDHWQPLSVSPENALHWKNLYLSCSSPETCDGAKKDRPLRWDDTDEPLPWPSDRRYELLIGFTSHGDAYVRRDVGIDMSTRRALELSIADQVVNNVNRKSLLNLNHHRLREARRAAIDSEMDYLERKFLGRRASPADREKIATSLLAENPCASFVSIRVAFLRGHLGKGR